jgi:hypothetical protein
MVELVPLNNPGYTEDIRGLLAVPDVTKPQPVDFIGSFKSLFRRHRSPSQEYHARTI